MRLLFVLAILVVSSIHLNAKAMWEKLSEQDLVSESDMIVMGTLTDQKNIVVNQTKFFVGVLMIEEVLKGDQTKTEIYITLLGPEAPRSSTDILYQTGQTGLWFLRAGETADEVTIYLTDHPQRFLAADQVADRLRDIRQLLN